MFVIWTFWTRNNYLQFVKYNTYIRIYNSEVSLYKSELEMATMWLGHFSPSVSRKISKYSLEYLTQFIILLHHGSYTIHQWLPHSAAYNDHWSEVNYTLVFRLCKYIKQNITSSITEVIFTYVNRLIIIVTREI